MLSFLSTVITKASTTLSVTIVTGSTGAITSVSSDLITPSIT
jgi:hypothetical protein